MNRFDVPFLDLRAGYLELQSELDLAYKRVMESGWYVLGEQCRRFETDFSAFCSTEFCVGASNGLDALALILRAYEIGAGDEVIVPAHTFIATWLAVSQVGAKPVPVDISDDDYNLNPGLIESAITANTRAVMPVHLYGYPARMTEIGEIARHHGLAVIEDAAQAHGATCGGIVAGGLSDAAAFSFYPGKNLGAFGDGGAVVTDNEEIAERVRLLRNYGSRAKYQHEAAGYNARLDELQAALLRVKLKSLNDWNMRRAEVARRYCKEFSGLDSITLPPQSKWAQSSWHLFVVRHPDRERFRAALSAKGIETLIHYPITPAAAGAYEGAGIDAAAYSVATAVSNSVLSLPIGPHMKGEQVDRVIEAVMEVA